MMLVKNRIKYQIVVHTNHKRSPPHQAQLAKFEDEAIPWSFESITYDSGGKKIGVVNTCAHNTVLMALFWFLVKGA